MNYLNSTFNERQIITIIFKVDFDKKDDAKAVGARWNPKNKYWYNEYQYSNVDGLEDGLRMADYLQPKFYALTLKEIKISNDSYTKEQIRGFEAVYRSHQKSHLKYKKHPMRKILNSYATRVITNERLKKYNYSHPFIIHCKLERVLNKPSTFLYSSEVNERYMDVMSLGDEDDN